jgi:hypothetical protein
MATRIGRVSADGVAARQRAVVSLRSMDDVGHCDSCGDDAVEVVALHRIYLTPEAWDQEEKVEVLDEVERWCFPCRTSYPHQLLD